MKDVFKFSAVSLLALAGALTLVFYSRNLGVEEAYTSCEMFGFFEYDGTRMQCMPDGPPKKKVLQVVV
jgi:hypothetical protein